MTTTGFHIYRFIYPDDKTPTLHEHCMKRISRAGRWEKGEEHSIGGYLYLGMQKRWNDDGWQIGAWKVNTCSVARLIEDQ
jgi:hypothetical protein